MYFTAKRTQDKNLVSDVLHQIKRKLCVWSFVQFPVTTAESNGIKDHESKYHTVQPNLSQHLH